MRILTRGDMSETVEIGADGSHVHFAADPVEINSCVNDSFDTLLRSEATVRLSTRTFLKDLFTENITDGVVNILREGRVLFAGFIEPQVYNQSYVDREDDLDITCLDLLSAMQYLKFSGIGRPGSDYAAIRRQGGSSSLRDLLIEAVDSLADNIIIQKIPATAPRMRILCADTRETQLLSALGVARLLMLGDDEESTWTMQETADQILRTLNMHMCQNGDELLVFPWSFVRPAEFRQDPTPERTMQWLDLRDPDSGVTQRRSSYVTLTPDNVEDADTSLSIGEVYNRISVCCETKAVDELIRSPLEEDDLTSPFSRRQKYLTEYSIGNRDVNLGYRQLRELIHRGLESEYAGMLTDWYVQVMEHPGWEFTRHADVAEEAEAAASCAQGTDQHCTPNCIASSITAALMKVGSIDYELPLRDDSPKKLDMKTMLVIGVNGNGNDTPEGTYPSAADLQRAAPLAVYRSEMPGEALNPSGSSTNYIVFSGTVGLALPLADSVPWRELDGPSFVCGPGSPGYGNLQGYGKLAYSDDRPTDSPEKWARYYSRKFYTAHTPGETLYTLPAGKSGMTPLGERSPYIYTVRGGDIPYPGMGDITHPGMEDVINKVPVLHCMLRVGDKCLVEVGSKGVPSDFEWHTYKTPEECADLTEYYCQSFTLGFNPKPDDYLVGPEHDLCDNIGFDLGIDAKGTAIPVRHSDKLQGDIEFSILGPAFILWDDHKKKHTVLPPPWQKPWEIETIPLLAHVSHIELKSFEVKIYNDLGAQGQSSREDIVYTSDTSESCINPKDDITFRIHSALSATDRAALGMSEGGCLSHLIFLATGEPFECSLGQASVAPLEQHYVDAYYKEYHRPRIMLEQQLQDKDADGLPLADCMNIFRHPALPQHDFFVQGLSRNLREACATLTLKECPQND